MSSGYFPLSERNEHYEKLKQVMAILERVVEDHRELACGLDNADDACYDGECIARLAIANKLIGECLR